MRFFTTLLFVFMSALIAKAYDFESNGIYYNILSSTDKTVEVTYEGNKKYSGDIVIPTTVNLNGKELTVVAIGKSAFSRCPDLTSITFGDSIKTIGDEAFIQCKKLKNFTLGSKVNLIACSAFESCKSLTRIEIPGNVETIELSAFSYCENVTEIIIHNGVKNIGNSAFYNNKKITEFIIPASVEKIGSSAIYGCDSLKVLTIEDSNKELFVVLSYPWSNQNLDKFYIGRNIRENYTNWREITAKEIIIGRNVTKLNWTECINLETITLLGTTPPASNEFTEGQYAIVKVNVPEEAIPAYQATEPWNKFWSLPTGINQAEVAEDEVEAVYSINGQRCSMSDNGVLILKMKSGKIVKVVK